MWRTTLTILDWNLLLSLKIMELLLETFGNLTAPCGECKNKTTRISNYRLENTTFEYNTKGGRHLLHFARSYFQCAQTTTCHFNDNTLLRFR